MRSAYLTKSISAATVRAINYTPELGQFLQHHQGADVSRLGNLASIRSPGSAMFRAIIATARSVRTGTFLWARAPRPQKCPKQNGDCYNCSPEFGEEFLTQADIFAAEPTGRTIRPDTIPDLESRRVKKGQILIAGVGTLGETELYGRSIIADDRLVGKLLTSDTLVLEPTLDEDTHYYVYAFLCTSVGVRLVRSASAGTKLLRPRRDLLRNLPVPLPDRATLKKVADLIRTTVTERERYLREIQAARACLEALPEMQEAIASKGCYPAYSQPSQEQFYWADTIIQVNRGGKTTIEVKPTQLSNQQVHELVTGKLSNSSVPTFGGTGCEPAPAS
jgi:hypothetical protein